MAKVKASNIAENNIIHCKLLLATSTKILSPLLSKLKSNVEIQNKTTKINNVIAKKIQ